MLNMKKKYEKDTSDCSSGPGGEAVLDVHKHLDPHCSENHIHDHDHDHGHGDEGCDYGHGHDHDLCHEHGSDDGCGCGHDHEHGGEDIKSVSFIAGIVLFAAGIGVSVFAGGLPFYVTLILFLAAYLLVGKEVLMNSARNIAKGQIFDENFLMAIASIGAFIIGEYPEAVAVMLFYRAGEYVQGRAIAHSKKSISALMDIRPDTANLKTETGMKEVRAETVKIGDIIVIKAGEKVPLDGVVTEGASTMDTKALTGESLPVDVSSNSKVLSGSINGSGMLLVRTEKAFGESTASKILEMVENAGNKKAKTENFITKFARYYTPAVVIIAVALAVIPPILGAGAFSDWLYRALVFLVVSCPCALVISIPLGFFGGIGAASSRGILVKGSNYLEALNNVDTVVFDKTGTLTSGIFSVTEVKNAKGFTADEVLEYGAHAENYSTHPIAVSIRQKYCDHPGISENVRMIREEQISDIEERAGFGIAARVKGKRILAGNFRLMEAEGIVYEKEDAAGTIVYITADGIYAGAIVIADQAKQDSLEAVRGLRRMGVRQTVMLTGDSEKIGRKIGDELGIDKVYAQLLPNEKVEVLEEIFKERESNSSGKRKGSIIFAGDGINDAPVLARADVGIAMGGVGSDAAIEAADVVIMNDEPSKIITALRIASRTRMIVWQNIALALGVKAIVLILGAVGIATMWEAVFADVGVAILAVLNAVRAGHIKENK